MLAVAVGVLTAGQAFDCVCRPVLGNVDYNVVGVLTTGQPLLCIGALLLDGAPVVACQLDQRKRCFWQL